MVPPDQNLPPHIRKLTGFGERAEFSLDSKRVLFLSKTFGDAMEIDLATGVIRNLTAHFPHFGFTRALYLANGHILLSGPTEFNPANVGAARTNCWLFVLDPAGNARPQPLGVKAAEGPVPSRKRMHIAWSYRAAQFPGGEMPPGSSQMHEADIVYENGAPKLANQRKILDSRDVPFSVTLEPQNYRPPQERELIFSAYDYQQTEVFGIDLATGKLTNYSNGPGVYDEPEGIFPSGEFTTVESDKHNPAGQGFRPGGHPQAETGWQRCDGTSHVLRGRAHLSRVQSGGQRRRALHGVSDGAVGGGGGHRLRPLPVRLREGAGQPAPMTVRSRRYSNVNDTYISLPSR